MGHTGPRTTASLLRYTIGVWNKLFTNDAGAWTFHPELVTPSIAADIGDGVGAANDADRKQYPGQPFPTSPDTPSGPDLWPIAMQPPMWGGTRRSGDGPPTAGPWADPRTVTCVPITVPAAPPNYAEPTLTMSVAEYRSPPSFKQASLSIVPGDFITALSLSQGNTAAPSVTVGQQVQPGGTIYFNFRFWSPDNNAPSTDESQQGVTFGGGWPK